MTTQNSDKTLKNNVLKKLGVQERGAFNILNNKELCHKIINSNPIWIEDFIKKYDFSKNFINTLIEKNLISCFSNIKNQGSKIFIFEEEVLSHFPINQNPFNLYKKINYVIELYLLRVKDTITTREYEVVNDLLINNLTVSEASEKYNITKYTISQIFDRAVRRLKHSSRISNNYDTIKSDYEDIEHKYRVLKNKYDVLKNNFNKCNVKEFGKYNNLNIKVIDLHFSVRTLNALLSKDIETLFELVSLNKKDLLALRNFGKKSLTEIEYFLEKRGLQLDMNIPNNVRQYFYKQNNLTLKINDNDDL